MPSTARRTAATAATMQAFTCNELLLLAQEDKGNIGAGSVQGADGPVFCIIQADKLGEVALDAGAFVALGRGVFGVGAWPAPVRQVEGSEAVDAVDRILAGTRCLLIKRNENGLVDDVGHRARRSALAGLAAHLGGDINDGGAGAGLV